MRIILHVGRHKTGTSSLQRSLILASKTLRKHGILYPVSDFSRFGHHFLPYLCEGEDTAPDHFQNIHGITYDEVVLRCRDIWDGIGEEAARTKPEVLVLSTELLWGAKKEAAARGAVDLLRKLSDDIQVVAYLRNPPSAYLSYYQQRRWAFGQRPTPQPFPDRHILEYWDDASGGRLSLAIFDPKTLHDGDIVSDFCHRYLGDWLPDLDDIPPSRANVSRSVTCLDLLEAYDAQHGRGQNAKRSRLVKRIQKLEQEHGLVVRPTLKPEVAAQIIRASTDLLWLRDTHRIVFPDCDYDSIDGVWGPVLGLENPGFSDICDYDTEKYAKLKALIAEDLPVNGPEPAETRSGWEKLGKQIHRLGGRLAAWAKGSSS